ncbi:MAG: DUF1320 domain-containing protein [Sphingobacteriales bacterium]|nr:MAG: DUF1320 domain-containing protein [Sphingobacteriales bacterium]
MALGDSRNHQLLIYTIDIALYHLHSRLSPGNIPKIRLARYSQAISWLKQVAAGELTIDLPRLPATEKGRIRFGGNIKQINSY